MRVDEPSRRLHARSEPKSHDLLLVTSNTISFSASIITIQIAQRGAPAGRGHARHRPQRPRAVQGRNHYFH